MITIRFVEAGRSVRVPRGTPLLEAGYRAGVVIEAPCGAGGTCGKCLVQVVPRHAVRALPACYELSGQEQDRGLVLACATIAVADMDVCSTDQFQDGGLRILSEGREADLVLQPLIRKSFSPALEHTEIFSGATLLGREFGNTVDRQFGLAVDVGTTTLVAALYDLGNGRELGVATELNPQARFAQDVLSRIRLAGVGEQLQVLQQAVIAEINRLIGRMMAEAGVSRNEIYEAVLSGNTCMLHLAAGVDPTSLGHFPYAVSLTGDEIRSAAAMNLDIARFGQIWLPPVISAYVGADIVSGILACGLHRRQQTVLLVDIGTNGEMVLAHQGRLWATSTAAGPAFEGMNIRCGMRASSGAVEGVRIDEQGQLGLTIVGEGAPLGLCGSGLLDLVAELVRSGVITAGGGLVRSPTSGIPEALGQRLEIFDGKPVFRVSTNVWLSRGDIRQVQLAKSAVRTGIDLLLKHAGIDATTVEEILIAGSFGAHLRPESLLGLGLLPVDFAERIVFVGNTSKSGARTFLLNGPSRREAAELVPRIQVVDLGRDPDFDRTFVRNLSLGGI